jgi:hypothetical protein
MTNPFLNIFAKNSLPDLNQREPYSLYFVAPTADPDYVEISVTGETSDIVKRVINKSDIEALISNSSSVKVVADIPTRDNLTPQTDIIVLVLDASADPEVVDSTPATYIYNFDSSSWVRVTAGSSTTPQPVEFVENESIIFYLSPRDTDIYVTPRANIIPYLPYGLKAQELILKCDAAPIGSEIKVDFIIDSHVLIGEIKLGASIDSDSFSVRDQVLSPDGGFLAVAGLNLSNEIEVRIYENKNDDWTQVGYSIIENSILTSFYGSFISISENANFVAIGNNLNSPSAALLYAGSVNIYSKNNFGYWTQVGNSINGEVQNERSGWSVSLSKDGSVVAIGAPNADKGRVRVYRNINNNWNKIGDDIIGEAADDYSGYSVSLSADGTVVAIGARFNDGIDAVNNFNSNRGHVRVYQNVNDTWTQVGGTITGDIDGEAPADYSGTSVSLSADGSVVAIGAPGNNGNGSYSGHVRVYQNVNGSWTQVGSDIDGEAQGDFSGWSVSLSADGTVVAIGGGVWGDSSGQVQVYKNTDLSGDWIKLGNNINGEIAGGEIGNSVSLSAEGSILLAGGGSLTQIYEVGPSVTTMSIPSNSTQNSFIFNKTIQRGTNLQVDITQIGEKTPGQNLVLTLNGERY